MDDIKDPHATAFSKKQSLMKTQNKAVCRTMTQHWMKQNTTEDGPVQRTPILERARGDGLTGSSNRTPRILRRAQQH